MNKKATTLIELIVAVSILTISVFWVYKLIWENYKIINNSNSSIKTNFLFIKARNCIKNLGLDSTSNIYIENNKTCQIWNKLTIIDNIEYEIKAEKKDNNGNTTGWIITITSPYEWTLTWFYLKK
jgi:hypothetical protein